MFSPACQVGILVNEISFLGLSPWSSSVKSEETVMLWFKHVLYYLSIEVIFLRYNDEVPKTVMGFVVGGLDDKTECTLSNVEATFDRTSNIVVLENLAIFNCYSSPFLII